MEGNEIVSCWVMVGIRLIIINLVVLIMKVFIVSVNKVRGIYNFIIVVIRWYVVCLDVLMIKIVKILI